MKTCSVSYLFGDINIVLDLVKCKIVCVMWGRPYSRKRRARDVRHATERAAGSQPPASGHAEQAVLISG